MSDHLDPDEDDLRANVLWLYLLEESVKLHVLQVFPKTIKYTRAIDCKSFWSYFAELIEEIDKN